MTVGVLVLGTGDVGSAVAYTLLQSGAQVVMHDTLAPSHARRGMAFVDAVFEGSCQLDGIVAKRVPLSSVLGVIEQLSAISIVVEDLDTVLQALPLDILIDARMRKRADPSSLIDPGFLSIGLGPNFVAGETVDYAIETAWGDELGRVISIGGTRSLVGEPRSLGGYGRERFTYADSFGHFSTCRRIGDVVQAGEPVAALSGKVLSAPLTGRLRGLSHDGAEIDVGAKVIEIDPRGDDAVVFGLGERPLRIAEGVLDAIHGAGIELRRK